jgi:predicted  nucleic acid-binding Zn-ribbon protein
MAERRSVETSLARLDQAIGRLEVSVARRLDVDRSLGALETELQRLGEDRSKLALDLDQSAARSARLEEANREVSRRLVAAMESIRAVLERHGG